MSKKLLGLALFLLPILLYAQTDDSVKPEQAKPPLQRDFDSPRESIIWSELRKKVRAKLPSYTLEELKYALAELDLDAQYFAGDIIVSANADYTLTVESDERMHNFQFTPGISKKILPSGTTLSAEMGMGLGIVETSTTTTHTSTLRPKVTVTQDLLQNFFGLLHRISVDDAKRKLEIAEQNRKYTERKLQKSYDELYLNWILLWRKREVLQEQLGKSTQSLANAQTQRNQNYIDEGQYQQFYSAHLTYQRSLQSNEEQLLHIDQRLARFLGAKLYKPETAIVDVLLQQTSEDLPPLQFADSWDWAISDESLQRLNILYEYSKLQRLPNLTLSASLALETQATYTDSEQPSYSELKPTYGVGIKLSWPALMRKAKHSMESLRLQLKQLETVLDQQRQDFDIRIAKQRSGLQFLRENYVLQQEFARTRTAIYASNQVKYRQARANLRDLLDAEIRKLAADLDLLQTESDLVKQLLEYSYETQDQDILESK